MEHGVKSTSAVIFPVGYQHMTLNKRTMTPISHIRATEEVKSKTVQGIWAVFIVAETEYKSSASQLNVKANISLINTGTDLSLMGINCLASLTYPLQPHSFE